MPQPPATLQPQFSAPLPQQGPPPVQQAPPQQQQPQGPMHQTQQPPQQPEQQQYQQPAPQHQQYASSPHAAPQYPGGPQAPPQAPPQQPQYSAPPMPLAPAGYSRPQVTTKQLPAVTHQSCSQQLAEDTCFAGGRSKQCHCMLCDCNKQPGLWRILIRLGLTLCRSPRSQATRLPRRCISSSPRTCPRLGPWPPPRLCRPNMAMSRCDLALQHLVVSGLDASQPPLRRCLDRLLMQVPICIVSMLLCN